MEIKEKNVEAGDHSAFSIMYIKLTFQLFSFACLLDRALARRALLGGGGG